MIRHSCPDIRVLFYEGLLPYGTCLYIIERSIHIERAVRQFYRQSEKKAQKIRQEDLTALLPEHECDTKRINPETVSLWQTSRD